METPSSNLEPSKKSWIASHMILGIVFLLAAIGAVAAGIYYSQTASSVPTSIDLPVHKEKVDPMANWKTYTNSQYGFEFKYPPNFQNIKTPNTDFNFIDSKGTLLFSADLQSDSLSVQMLHKSFDSTSIQTGFGLYKAKDSDKVNIGAREGYKYEIGDAGCVAKSFVTELNKETLQISIGHCGDAITTSRSLYEDNSLINQILSNFKFTASSTSTINSFVACAAAGYPIMESFPEQCKTPDGVTFIKQSQACSQVITPAKNPKTGEIRDFPTPCDVPVGWENVQA